MSTQSKSATKSRCAECRGQMPAREENKNFPFCSARCKQIDLGRWLNEEYTLPMDRDTTERALPEELDE